MINIFYTSRPKTKEEMDASPKDTTKIVYPEPQKASLPEIGFIKKKYEELILNKKSIFSSTIPDWTKVNKILDSNLLKYEIYTHSSNVILDVRKELEGKSTVEEFNKISKKINVRILLTFDPKSNKIS